MRRRWFPACFAALLAFLVLAGCDMPEKPEGADSEGFALLGDKLKAQGDDAGAANFYQRALQRRPDDTGTRASLAGILEKHGAYDAAEAQYAEALKYDSSDPDLLRGEGRVLLRQGRAEAARADYQKVLDDHPDDVKALNGIGVALDMLGQHGEAQRAYGDALKVDPNDYTTLSNLAHSYTLAGDTKDAIALIERHAYDKKAPAALRQNLAEAYGLAGMDADAERMARMDLPPAEVKRNLAWYKAQRAKLMPAAKPYAELDSFATADMAASRAAQIEQALPGETAHLTLTAMPVVREAGGTPRFVLRADGFGDIAHARDFCAHMKKRGFACAVQGGTP